MSHKFKPQNIAIDDLILWDENARFPDNYAEASILYINSNSLHAPPSVKAIFIHLGLLTFIRKIVNNVTDPCKSFDRTL